MHIPIYAICNIVPSFLSISPSFGLVSSYINLQRIILATYVYRIKLIIYTNIYIKITHIMSMLSAKAGCDAHGQDSSYFFGWQEYEKSPFHHLHNPNGIIQMGLAENQVLILCQHKQNIFIFL